MQSTNERVTPENLVPGPVIEREIFGSVIGFLVENRRSKTPIPYVRAGHRTCLYKRSEVRAWLEARRITQPLSELNV